MTASAPSAERTRGGLGALTAPAGGRPLAVTGAIAAAAAAGIGLVVLTLLVLAGWIAAPMMAYSPFPAAMFTDQLIVTEAAPGSVLVAPQRCGPGPEFSSKFHSWLWPLPRVEVVPSCTPAVAMTS